MSILKTKISVFESTRATRVIKGQLDTVEIYLLRIQNGTYKDIIEELRETGDDEIKKNLPTVAFHGIFENYRQKKDFIEASGLIILDIDDIPKDELEDIKLDIMDEYESVLACFVSPSGNGIKVLYYVESELINTENYRQIGKQIVLDFEIYGKVDFLSITDCLIMTYDPKILINENAIPDFIYIKDTIVKTGELEERDTSKPLWEDVEDFFETVLSKNIAEKTNNNFHYIQVAILDLAKFGFYHPQEDLSFVIDYAESEFNASPRNKERFLGVSELAQNYPQIKWPYRLIPEDGFDDDEYIDYTDYREEDEPEAKESKENIDNEEETIEAFIKAEGFKEKVFEKIKEGDYVGKEISFKNFSQIFRFLGTGILTVTGIPGHGKTEFVDACTVDLARLYDEDTIVVGYEQSPEEHVVKMMRKMIGKDITNETYFNNKDNDKEVDKAYEFITNHFHHIDTTVTGGNINTILTESAKRIKELRDSGRDLKYIVLDPFNMLSIKGRLSGHEKIEEILRRLIHFSKQMDVLVILVAHPFKMKKDEKTGSYEIPDFYSVKGSSAFFEMSYHGLSVYRSGYNANDRVLVRVLKVKQNNLGVMGEEAYFKYDRQSGRYIPIDEENNELSGDHRELNWLEELYQK